jgi:hypothetical protein
VVAERARQILALLDVTTMSKSPQRLTVGVGLVTLSTPIRRRTSEFSGGRSAPPLIRLVMRTEIVFRGLASGIGEHATGASSQ